MTVYLDASVLVPLVLSDVHSPRIDAWFSLGPDVTFSLWTVVEASSALSHRVRTGGLDPAKRTASEQKLDALTAIMPFTPAGEADFLGAQVLLRTDPVLRAPDALHLAIAQARNYTLATLDRRLAEAAARAGVKTEHL